MVVKKAAAWEGTGGSEQSFPHGLEMATLAFSVACAHSLPTSLVHTARMVGSDHSNGKVSGLADTCLA